MEGISKHLKRERLGAVEKGLFDLLSDSKGSECCWDLMGKFVDYLERTEELIKKKSLIDETMIAGKYPATKVVEEFDWGSMRKTIDIFKEGLKASNEVDGKGE